MRRKARAPSPKSVRPYGRGADRAPVLNRRQLLALSLAAASFGAAGTKLSAGAGRRHGPPRLSVDDFAVVLSGIEGAEGLATAPDGTLAFSCARAAVGIRWPDGRISYLGDPIATGGLAFDAQGRIVAASVGALHHREGPLRRIDPLRGTVEVLIDSLEGRRLVASNAPVVARDGTIYCSHSGWSVGNIGTTQAEGFIYALPPGAPPRIVARGLRGVNGLCLGPDDRTLLAAMTAEGRIAVWHRNDDGALRPSGFRGPPLGRVKADERAAEVRALPPRLRAVTGYCDGIVLDRAGTLYATLPFANRIVAIDRRGRLFTVVHDPAGQRVDFPTNLAWGGADLRDLFVVSRGSGMIVRTRMPVAGLPAANWPLAG